MRSYAYSELVELRLQPRGRDHALVASDRWGAEWSMPLAAGEVGLAHAALDAVDRLLAPSSAARPERRHLGAVVACAGAIMALLVVDRGGAAGAPGDRPDPSRPARRLRRVGAGGGRVRLLAGSPPGAVFDPSRVRPATLGLVVCGAAALWIARDTAWREAARRTRSAPLGRPVPRPRGLGFLVPTPIGARGGRRPAGPRRRARPPGGAVLLIGATATLLVVPRRWGRVAAAVGGSWPWYRSSWDPLSFAGRFVADPFFAPGARTGAAATLALELIDEQTLPAQGGQLELSPSGDSWAIHRFELGGAGGAPVHGMIVGSKGGGSHRHEASDLVLLDDRRLLAFFEDGERPAVELRPHDPDAEAVWRVELEPLVEGALIAADPATGRWRVSGTHAESGLVVRVAGERDGTFTVARWDPEPEGAVWVIGEGPAVLGIAPHLAATERLLESSLDEDSPALLWQPRELRRPGARGPGLVPRSRRPARALRDTDPRAVRRASAG